MNADGLITADHYSINEDYVTIILKQPEINLLEQRGFKIKIKENMLKQIEQVKDEVIEAIPSVEDDGTSSGFVTRYLDAKEIIDKFESFHNEFKDIVRIIDLPYKTSGYDGKKVSLRGPSTIKLFRINTDPDPDPDLEKPKPGMLLISGTHAREWVPPLASIEFLGELLSSYSPGSTNPSVQQINKIIEGLDIFIVPTMNYDGINYSRYDNPDWRKNRNVNLVNVSRDCIGVDNNRNYNIYWGEFGSSAEKCNDAFRGESPLSEPENKNVAYVLKEYPNIITAIDCHSHGEKIYRPQPTGGIYIPSQPVKQKDHETYLKLESSMNTAISSVSPGKFYETGTTNNHAGTSDDYFYFEHKIYGFNLECVKDTFWPSIEEAIKTTKEVSYALRTLASETLLLGK